MRPLKNIPSTFILFFLPRLLLAIGTFDGLERGIELFNAGDVSAAKQIFQNVVHENPDNADAQYYLARIYLGMGDIDNAESFCKTAVELAPNNPLYHKWLANVYVAKINHVGMFKKWSVAKKIKRHFLIAVTLDENDYEARFGLIQYYCRAPGIAGGSKKEARKQVEILTQKSPYWGRLASFNVNLSAEAYRQAEQDCYTLMTEFPDSTDTHMNMLMTLGYHYQKQKAYATAVSIFEKVIERQPDRWYAWYQIGRTGALSGQNLERAEACLQHYIEHNDMNSQPGIAAAYWRLGMIYTHRGDRKMACTAYRKCLELDPDHKEARKALKKNKCSK